MLINAHIGYNSVHVSPYQSLGAPSGEHEIAIFEHSSPGTITFYSGKLDAQTKRTISFDELRAYLAVRDARAAEPVVDEPLAPAEPVL